MGLRPRLPRIARFLGGVGALLLAAMSAAAQTTVTRLSVNRAWRAANGDSLTYAAYGSLPSMSADGRWIVFDSMASNLIPGDSNAFSDLYVQEVATGRIRRLTEGANGLSYAPSISANGRYVAFTSDATNLDPYTTDSNACADVYVCDRDPDGNGTLDENNSAFVRVSVDEYGGEAYGRSWLPTISADGMRVLFLSDANLVNDDNNGATDAFLRDRVNGTTERVDVPDGSTGEVEADYGCGSCDLSADGWTVAFDSWSDNLVRGDTNGVDDVFVRNLGGGSTSRVSVGSYGFEGDGSSLIRPHCITSDGSRVVFTSFADNLDPTDANPGWDVFVHDRSSGVTTLMSTDTNGSPADGDCSSASISADGSLVVFSSLADNLAPGDANGASDVFVHEVSYGTTTLVSVSTSGGAGSGASNLATISADGRSVVFGSHATDLDPDDVGHGFFDVFFADVASRAVRDVTALPAGEANGQSCPDAYTSISPDGRYVAFTSAASNLVPDDTNGQWDVFVDDRTTGSIVRVSVDSAGAEANYGSYTPTISADGRFVAFASDATNLVALDTNWTTDIFRHDRDPDGNGIFDEGNGVTIRVSVDSSGAEGNWYSIRPSISGNGNRIAFASRASNLDPLDTNGIMDIFVRDIAAGSTSLVSVDGSGVSGDKDSYDPSISGNGNVVAFATYTNFEDRTWSYSSPGIYARRLDSGEMIECRAGTSNKGDLAHCAPNCVSNDGSRVVFGVGYYAPYPILHAHAMMYDIDWFDLLDLSGDLHAAVEAPSISADGRTTVFAAWDDNLVPGDTNGQLDAFLCEVGTDADGRPTNPAGGLRLVSVDLAGNAGTGSLSSVSENGDFISFASDGTNLVSGDTNGARDVFLFDRSQEARWYNYGPGFAFPHNVPFFTSSAAPVLGSTITLTLGNSSGNPVNALVYLSPRAVDVPLTWGATLLVDLSTAVSFLIPLGGAGGSFAGTVPNDPSLSGVSIYMQALEADAAVPKKLSFTPGLALHFGH